jgi:hypothetical protein
VFERLGASVVFANGQIDATSGRHTIELRLGSTDAVVDGIPTVLDVPPFLIGARTLVPLRFISQALGATVDFDSGRQTVYVTQHVGPPRAAIVPPPPPAGPIALRLLREEPFDHASIDRMRPEISSTFAVPVIADSVRITLDDRDVTANAYISDRSFVFTPTYDLPTGPHVVVLHGRVAGGRRFDASWTFASNAVENPNRISDLAPPNGTPIGDRFSVHGVSEPGSRIHMVATTNATMERFSDEVSLGAQVVDVTADERGFFRGDFEMADHAASVVDVRVTSTAPDGSVAVRTLRLRP